MDPSDRLVPGSRMTGARDPLTVVLVVEDEKSIMKKACARVRLSLSPIVFE